MIKITYGTVNKSIDVTDICYAKLVQNNIITIPAGDLNRAKLFTDPLVGVLKQVFLTQKDNTIFCYDDTMRVMINVLNTNNVFTTCVNIDNKLSKIHSKLNIKYGSFKKELPEQKMVVRYLSGNEKVLEIGGNIGRNSLVISSILANNNNNHQQVTLECDQGIAAQLTENRDRNKMSFHIERSALSNRKLIQKGWNTMASNTLLPGYKSVKIISLMELKNKYNIQFDTLVLDCEGAFYYILMDMPEILHNIKLIIMENDYKDIVHKNYVDDVLKTNGFYVDYVESGGWGPCKNMFFEVWKRS
jgi:FkbM family methyltransferase